VAFKGHPQEYEASKSWIGELAQACGCPLERVFVIPGNHDVDRGVIMSSAAVRNAQAAIMTAASDRREGEFRTQFMDRPLRPYWLQPAIPMADRGSAPNRRQRR
jgi:hypothetical protein